MDNKESIAFFIPSLKRGGAERVVSILANELSSTSLITVFLLYGDVDYILNPKINVISLNFKRFNLIEILIRLNTEIRKRKISKVICFLYRSSFLGIFSKLIFRWPARLIVSERTYTLSHYNNKTIKGRIGILLIKALYNKADMVIANSKLTAYSLKHDLAIKKPIHVIYNPIIEPKFESVSLMKSECFKIINVGNLFNYKYQHILIHALSEIKLHNWHLSIVGDGPEKEKLINLVKSYGLETKVEFLGNIDSYSLYAKYDIFISSSSIEGFPNSLVEAMVHGLPVISADCKSGPREILAPSTDFNVQLNMSSESEFAEYGILVPVGKVTALVKAIEVLMTDKIKLNSYKLASIKRGQDFFTKNIIDQFIKII